MPEILATRVEVIEPEVKENDTPGVVKDTTPDHIEKPLELFDKPFVSELLGLGEAVDHFEMQSLTAEIDEFVKEELEYKEVKLSKDTYKELIDSYLARLKLPDGINVYTKVEKLHRLMAINRKLLQAAKEKQEFLNTSPADMTSTQLKNYLKTI